LFVCIFQVGMDFIRSELNVKNGTDWLVGVDIGGLIGTRVGAKGGAFLGTEVFHVLNR
jgi:hypothetical protein